MGSLVVTMNELLEEPHLVLDQWFRLDGAAPESQILLRAELKVRMQTHLRSHMQVVKCCILLLKTKISVMPR